MHKALVVVAVLLVCASAHAQFSLQRFRPAVDSQGLVTVNASQPLSHLSYSLGLVGSYAYEALSLDNELARYRVDHFVTVQLQAALGLFGGPRWGKRMHGISLQLGVTLPVHIVAGARFPETPRRNFSAQSIGDVGVNLKVRFLDPSRHHLGLALLFAVDFPSARGDFVGEGQTTFRPTLILDKELKRLRLALNLGALLRPATHTFLDPTTGLGRSSGNEVSYSLGVSYAVVLRRFDLVGEVFGSHGFGLSGADPVELLAAAKVYMAQSSFFELGASAGILPRTIADGRESMTGLPLVRVFVGFVFEPTVGDRDHDGIKDDIDLCPDEPETRNGFQDEDGCPDEVPIIEVKPVPPAPEPEPPVEEQPVRARRQGGRIVIFEKVYFKTASADCREHTTCPVHKHS